SDRWRERLPGLRRSPRLAWRAEFYRMRRGGLAQKPSRTYPCRMRFLIVLFALCAPAYAETWISPLAGRNLIVVDTRRVPSPALDKALGPDRVVYESFVAARVPAKRNITVLEGLAYSLEPDRPLAKSDRIGPVEIPGLYLVRFAFPVKPQWLADLARCGAGMVA